MRTARRFLARAWNFVSRCQGDQRLREEMEEHLAMLTADYVRLGLPPEEARRRAVLKFGPAQSIREDYRAEKGLPLLAILLDDSRYALRMLHKASGFTTVAILTMALGIGATTAMFSIVNAVLLRSLPFPEPERLVRIFFNNPGAGMHGVLYSVPELNDLRNRAGVFQYVTGTERGSIDFTGGLQPERLEMLTSSSNYFAMLGASPQLGRLFSSQDELPGYAPYVVISDSLWRRDFGADPHVLGRTIHLDNDPYQIIGVLPPDFRHPGRASSQPVEVWLASGFTSAADPKPVRSARAFPSAVGRLKRGISLQQAQARLSAMAIEIRRDFPADYPPESKWTIEVLPMQEDIVGKVRPMLLVLLCAVLLIVFIVSLNIANLLMARASARRQEIAIRSALGASRRRIFGQMLTESAVLSIFGGAAGMAVAFASLHFLLRFTPTNLPRLSEVNIDWRVLMFALLISILTGLLFGLAPAVQSTRTDAVSEMREGSRGSGHSRQTRRLRDTLIVSELALAVVLMVGAGLLLRTLNTLLAENPGFNPARVVAARVNLPFPNDPKDDPYSSVRTQTNFYRELGRRVNRLPGIELAGFSSDLPVAGLNFIFGLGIEDRRTNGQDDLHAKEILVNPDYFRVLQAPLIRGRTFTEADEDGKQRVAIVDESTARRYWPDREALGKRIRTGQGAWMTIVGIVKDIKQDGLDMDGLSHVYVPMYQEFDVAPGYVFRDFCVLARTSLPASAIDVSIRRVVESIDPRLPVYDVASMNELLDRSLGSRRFAAELVGGFAVLSLLLASIGIYGVLAYMVGQRSREIGLRMALGATRSDIVRLVLGKGAGLAAAGVTAGVVLAASASSMMASLLYGVPTHDPAVFLCVPILLLAVALLASYLPARRATKVDPMFALREA